MRDQIEFFMNLEEEKTNNNRTEWTFSLQGGNVDVNVNTN